MEEESFQLLSSMSPKVKHCQKHFRKGTTVLALRRSLQRSGIYDRSLHTTGNDELILTETSSSSTTTASGTSKSSSSGRKLLNKSPIVIHDSDSDNDTKSHLHKSPDLTKQSYKTPAVNDLGSLSFQNKFENIKQWINRVNLECEVRNNSVYSELSTIYGEEGSTNFVTEKTGRAVNSTVIDSASIHFEKQFKPKTEIHKPKVNTKNISDFKQVIDESYIEQDSSLSLHDTKDSYRAELGKTDRFSNDKNFVLSINRNYYLSGEKQSYSAFGSQKNLNNFDRQSKNDENECVNDSDDSFSLDKSLSTRLKSKLIDNRMENVCNKKSSGSRQLKDNSNNINASVGTNEEELASMLDDLYGNKWREKEEHILPKSEPRKQRPKPSNSQVTNSERKPKFSMLYKNPYLETEQLKSTSLLQTLQKSRLKNNVESLLRKQLHDFCDSDTDSNMSNKTKPRIKLNFDDSDCDEQSCKTFKNIDNLDTVNDEPITSKYFKNNRPLKKNGVPEIESKKESESDKENADEFSFLGQSLEERIRKKIGRLKDVCDGAKENKTPNNKKCLTRGDKGTKTNKIDKKTNQSTKRKEQNWNKRLSSPSNSSSDETWENEISKILHESKLVNGKYSFLASLSASIPILQCDFSARIYRNNFKLNKDELLKKLFKLYNEKVFENAIPRDTVLEWNDRMRGTAGFCYCKKITRKTGAVERTTRIVLSTKVIDSAYRLRDTLIHEMCHAATWIVNCVSDGHGPYWKSWAYKAMKTFPELPPIKRCHDYVINTKYTYKCIGCGYSIGRHSKSLDIERKRCGYCFGKFEVFLNKVSKKGETKSVPATPKKEATGFALFVKENYSAYKQKDLKHGEVMRLLGQKFQEMKLKPC